MSQKYVQSGDVIEFTAPGGGVVVDVPLLISSLVVIPMTTAAAGARFNGAVKGVFVQPKTAGAAWVEGQVLYFDSATSSFTTAQSATARRAAAAVVAALSADVTGTVRLENISAVVNVA
jgi:predicted RecA/RadA family phage recombinase